jgi:hypothetical protein
MSQGQAIAFAHEVVASYLALSAQPVTTEAATCRP